MCLSVCLSVCVNVYIRLCVPLCARKRVERVIECVHIRGDLKQDTCDKHMGRHISGIEEVLQALRKFFFFGGTFLEVPRACVHVCIGLARTIYTVYIRYFWQVNHQIYRHTQSICTSLANPMHVSGQPYVRGDQQSFVTCRGLAKIIHSHWATHALVGPSLNVRYVCVGLARTIYIRCVYGIFGREITIYTVIYGVYIRFWPTLCMWLRLTLPAYRFTAACIPHN